MSIATSLLVQLEAVHRDTIFPGTFDRIQWGMVAAFESHIARVSGKICLNSTTFWVTPDKHPNGAMTIQFGDAAEELGQHLTNDAFTQACNEPGDASIVIGFALNQSQAEAALKEHMAEGGGKRILIDPIEREERSLTPHPIRPRRGRR